jgi:hypothetical protein
MIKIIGTSIKKLNFLVVLSVTSIYSFGHEITQSSAYQYINHETGDVVIPDGITVIGYGAFRYRDVRTLVIPDTVLRIEDYAFDNHELSTLIIPDSVEYIGTSAFQGGELTSVVIPDSVNYLGQSSFRNNNLESVVISNSVTKIHDYTFQNNNLTSIDIPSSVQTIGQYAFEKNAVETLLLPENVAVIMNGAFSENQLSYVQFNENLQTIGDGAFRINRLDEINLPNSMRSIGSWAFEWNRLETIKVGSSLEEIGINTFANQTDLLGVPLENTTIYLSAQFDNTLSMKGLSGLESSTIIYCEDLDTDNDSEWNCFDENDDNDSALDIADAFPLDPTEQLDTDGDGIGNNADPDDDNDGLADEFDDLPLNASEQHDFDNDGIGNNADADDDNDGLSDKQELILGTNSWLADTDLDGVNDGLDAFPTDNSETTDTDGDGVGNNADNDDDNDGYVDIVDAMPTNANEWADTDADGIGNNADTDDDNDGVEDAADVFPYTASESVDTDGDGTGDNADLFPNDPTEAFDTDLDGIGNNADPDDDNDGVADADDDDPLNPDVTNQPKQLIAVMGEPVAVSGHFTNIFVSYDVSDANNQLNGIGFRVHYNNAEISLHNIQNTFGDSIVIDGMGPYQDIENFDSDESTDKYILFGWASIAGNWPNISLPENLTEIQFFVNTNDNQTTHITSNINFSIVDSAQGYLAKVVDYPMTILPATWDFDGNGKGDALTDGLMLLRYTFGLRDLAMTSGAVAENATLSSSQIAEGMEKAEAFADIDGNGSTDALTDGLMLLRYMFGLRGENLTRGAVSSDASRVSVESIENYISLYMPENTNIYTPITPAELASYQDCSEHKRHQETYNDDDSSDMYLTIVRVDDNRVKVSIVSANDDPIDYLNVTNLTGPSAYLGDLSISNGEASLIMSWLGGAPDAASFDIYWSKESYEGNWFVDKSIQPRVDLTATCDGQ